MKKILLLHIGFVFSAASIFGQEIPKLKVTHRDMTNVIFRYPKDNETVVEVQSNVAIEFESTMDKTVNVFQSYEESGFFFYELLFPIGKKHKGRKLKIKSYGCETYTEPIELQAKIPVGLLVLNLNDTVGVGCYFRHLNRGNIFFKSTQYADAKT
ncbi:MAG: hypothetical protein LBD45_03535, partial [Bacteroidales bacterium]|nr:hypothetical protein [Bacteroidales bacterium]